MILDEEGLKETLRLSHMIHGLISSQNPVPQMTSVITALTTLLAESLNFYETKNPKDAPELRARVLVAIGTKAV